MDARGRGLADTPSRPTRARRAAAITECDLAGRAPPTISAGRLAGTRLAVPDGMAVRPMRTRVRASVFAILADAGRLADATVVDLFAGSGSLGLEALSRGAVRCTFVERDRNVARVLRRNVQACDLPPEVARIVVADAGAFRPDRAHPPTLVLADPPFDLARPLPAWLGEPDAVAPHAWLVVEQPSFRDAQAFLLPGWDIADARDHGSSRVWFLARAPAGAAPGPG